MPPLSSDEDSQLVSKLHAISKKNPRLIRSSIYPAPAEPNTMIRSWKMNEFKYYDVPSPFPTLARGIFSIELEGKEEDAGKDDIDRKFRIVARGYDKFFNIGEVPWCTWQALKDNTTPPYTLSLKSNGCIIFIAALTPTKLLITSKHSIGPVQGVPLSHAQAGENWLHRHLEQMGRTEEQLAAVLWENNWTAIAELCDDSFEEHVLGYPPEKTGLHLHGLNVSTKEFKTLPYSAVDSFADEWGFIKTPTITLNTADEVKSFAEEIGRTGKWNGEAVEGFVVRTHIGEPPTDKAKSSTAPPYPPGSSFFFKIKFDEPYMMYRDWREVTKSLLSTKGPMNASKLPKSKMKRPETKLYVKWVISEIKRDRSQFDGFTKGKGIIETRERYLKWMETDQGKSDLEETKEGMEDSVTVADDGGKDFKKTIIVPVAIPGCGKTAVSVALAHIFGFGHTQSDDVQEKRGASQFIKNVTKLLETHDIVIADKNNHLKQHRVSLREVASKQPVPTRLLALNWAIAEKPQATIHRICGDRVTQRGDNHQTLRADMSAAKAHEEVIWKFIKDTAELTASEVDAMVEMDMEEGLEQAVRRAVDGVVRVIGLERPDDEKIQEAIGVIKGYKPKVKQPERTGKDTRGGVRYYGLLPEIELEEVMGEMFMKESAEGDGGEEEALEKEKGQTMFEDMRKRGRVVPRPHVTVVHKNSLPDEQKLWDACIELNRLEKPPLFKAKLGHLLWNDRVMALSVDDLDVEVEDGNSRDSLDAGKKFLEGMEMEVKKKLHITVGTKDEGTAPVEAKALVEAWRQGEDTIYSMEMQDAWLRGRLKGLQS